MTNMSTLPSVELGVLGPLQVRQDGAPVAIPGAKPRAILTMLGLHNGSVVPADTLIKLLWGDYPPRTAAKALQTHISSLRRTLGDGVVVTEGGGWTLDGPEVDAARYKAAAKAGRDAAAAGDITQAAARFEEALTLWRGIPELPDGQRGLSEKTRWIESHAALVEGVIFGLCKTAVDRMARDMAIELQPHNVASVSLWQGLTMTERAQRNLSARPEMKKSIVTRPAVGCSPEFPGRVIAALATDPDLMNLSGGTFITAELAQRYAITDIDGKTIPSLRAERGSPIWQPITGAGHGH